MIEVGFVTERAVVRAPVERAFALSTRVELVQRTLGMRPVSGVRSGHVEAGSRVEWRGWKFGLPAAHNSLITGFEAPHAGVAGVREAFFEDTQEKGRFAFFQHGHWFREEAGVTTMRDEVRFRLAWWMGGRVTEQWVLRPYIRGLVRRRFALLQEMAEGDGWREWVGDASQ